MPEWAYILSAVLISAAITWSLRAAPFALVGRIRESELLGYLNINMPIGLMTILVFYTLRHTPMAASGETLAVVAGLLVTGGLFWWRRGPVLAVVGGTAVHVALASTLA